MVGFGWLSFKSQVKLAYGKEYKLSENIFIFLIYTEKNMLFKYTK